MATQIISVRLSSELLRSIDEAALRARSTRSQWIQAALKAAVIAEAETPWSKSTNDVIKKEPKISGLTASDAYDEVTPTVKKYF